MTKKNIGYNEALEEMEGILAQIESNDLDVDQLADKVKRVAELLKLCKTKLQKAEVEVEKILKDIED